MEYRDFRYTNDTGNVELARGSLVGIAVSWLILKVLGFTLVLVGLGIGFCTWKYFTLDQVQAKPVDPMSAEAVYASPVAPIDYRLHPPPPGMTASAPAATMLAVHKPARPSRLTNPPPRQRSG